MTITPTPPPAPPPPAPPPPASPPSAIPDDVLRASFGQVLFRAARVFNELAIARVQSRSEPRVRLAHTLLFPHLTTAGVRATTLARKLGISKQAVGPLLDDLVEWGMLERVADPADRRAALLRLTPKGGAAMLDGLTVLQGITSELEADLGKDQLVALHTGLVALLDALEHRMAPPEPGP